MKNILVDPQVVRLAALVVLSGLGIWIYARVTSRVIGRIPAESWMRRAAVDARVVGYVALWAAVLGFALRELYLYITGRDLAEVILSAYRLSLLWGIVALLLAAKRRFVAQFAQGNWTLASGEVVDASAMLAVDKLASTLLVVPACLVSLQVFGVPLEALLTFGGVGGLAVSWAAKDMVANVFGGLMLYLHRPFRIGDWVRLPALGVEGRVDDMGWHRTVITSVESRPIYIPNGSLTGGLIENASRMRERRLRLKFGVRYQDLAHVRALSEQLRQSLVETEKILPGRTLVVYMGGFGPSSVDMEVDCYLEAIPYPEFVSVREKILLAIAAAVQDVGAEFAYPTQTLHVASLPAVP